MAKGPETWEISRLLKSLTCVKAWTCVEFLPFQKRVPDLGVSQWDILKPDKYLENIWKLSLGALE